MPIARQSTFTAGATLQAAQLNNEFNHIVDAFDGSGNISLFAKYNAADVPALKVSNSELTGKIASFLYDTTERVSIDADGQIVSYLSTGTAPLVIASTTKVANLNVDQVDGLDDTDLVRVAEAAQTITTATSSTALTLQVTGQAADTGVTKIEFDSRSGATNPDAWWRISAVADDTFAIKQYDDGTATWMKVLEFDRNGASPYTKVYDPTNDSMQQIATTKSQTTISIGAFYEGVVSTSAKTIRWICPVDAENVQFTYMQAVYGGGTPSGTTTLQIEHFNSSGTSQTTKTMSILSTDTVDVVQQYNMADITTVSAGDYFELTITAAGEHEDVSFWVQGTQEIIT
jgi:hypothetical protein